ncbi:MAG: hypothetical protein KKE23_01665 [Nanoarchaeota archaeon]|nr:hypothetical protein [Nanoarchaeota archaeon]
MIMIKDNQKDHYTYMEKSEADHLNTTPVNGLLVDYQGRIKGPVIMKALNNDMGYASKKKEIDDSGKARYVICLPGEVCAPLSRDGETSTAIDYHRTRGYQKIFLKEKSVLHKHEREKLEKILEKLKNQDYQFSITAPFIINP